MSHQILKTTNTTSISRISSTLHYTIEPAGQKSSLQVEDLDCGDQTKFCRRHQEGDDLDATIILEGAGARGSSPAEQERCRRRRGASMPCTSP